MSKWWRSLCLTRKVSHSQVGSRRERNPCASHSLPNIKSSAVALMLVVTKHKWDPNKNLLFTVNSKQVMLPHEHVRCVQTRGKERRRHTIASGQDKSYELLTSNCGYVNTVCLHPLLGSQIQNPSRA